jgi:uncharacterized membrane protein
MSLGYSLWGAICIITGWATTRFGFFGIKPEEPENTIINYVGVGLILFSTLFFIFVKPDVAKKGSSFNKIDDNPSITMIYCDDDDNNDSIVQHLVEKSSSTNSLLGRPLVKMIIGTLLSIVAGCLYGQSYNPMVYVKDNYGDVSQNNLDYIFSIDSGILLTSLFYFIVYSIVKKNEPEINSKLVLPGILAGLLWGLGNIAFFEAANILSESITFPIGCSGPNVVSALIGIVIYKEIKGTRNLIFLSLGFSATIAGCVLVALSSDNK